MPEIMNVDGFLLRIGRLSDTAITKTTSRGSEAITSGRKDLFI